jgi:hypothetical protein
MIVNTIRTSHMPANTDMTRATGFFTIHERKLSGFITIDATGAFRSVK